MTTRLIPLAAVACMACAALPLAAQTIDTFNGSYTSHTVVFSAGPPVQMLLEKTVDGPMPGGTRRLQLSPDTAAAGTASAALNGSGDLWAFASSGQRLAFNVAYGTQAPMNLDLSGAGALRLDVYYSSPMKLTIYASSQTTPGGNPDASALSIDLPDLFQQNVDIPLSAFTTNSGSGLPVNWADVDGLSIFVSANGPLPPSGDGFWIRELSAVPVPEPSPALLMALGLAGLAMARRRSVD